VRGAATGSVGGRPPRREPRSRPERSGAVRPPGPTKAEWRGSLPTARSRWPTLERTSLERLDEKLDGLDELPAQAFSGEPRALRQAQKKLWSKARTGRPR
jgi:hypothetical protein